MRMISWNLEIYLVDKAVRKSVKTRIKPKNTGIVNMKI